MNERQIKARRTFVLGRKTRKQFRRPRTGFWLHQRGYHHGDIRCTICDKWIDPVGDRFPDEPKEIEITRNGKKRHHGKYCNGYSGSRNGATFSTVPHIREHWKWEGVRRY